ncbi:tyrosine-type recombinase/integrase [Shewanella sp. WXL01]|uniref:tyrosine-type recombinase/integrase n=1 Tax=Shewanella sp. WXL01 TaxID=2709721 RepID=UPI0014382805|nr:site-specific integrase [Shewanella sp. WXL01]NKF52691.1 tyrosine-type recombinase/integrase [Shewanella sp. WXL01]
MNISIYAQLNHSIELYEEEVAQHQKGYRHTYQYQYKSIKHFFGCVPLKDFTSEDVRWFITQRQKQVSDATVKSDVGALQRFWNWLRRDMGLPLPNVFEHVRTPSSDVRREYIPTEAEISRVFSLLPDDVKPVAMLLKETGMRRSEAVFIHRTNVNLAKKYIQLFDTKNGTSRKVPLNKKAIEIVEKELSNGRGILFAVNPQRISKQVRKAADEVGLDMFVLHSLRHWRISSLIMKGMDHALVAGVSGHKDMRMLMRYTKHDATSLAGMLD